MKPLPMPPALDWKSVDHVVVLPLGSWKAAQAMLRARGEISGNRMAYGEGVLEIMSPSWNHEFIKKSIARLLEAWALTEGIPLTAAGSWTLSSASVEAMVEPDECYLVGPKANRTVPDLAIEVRWTGGGIEKLPLYAALGVKEVWVWERARINAHVLRNQLYVRSARSTLFQALNLSRLAKHATMDDQTRAIMSFLKKDASKKQ